MGDILSRKIAEYLQQHLLGEVMTSEDALEYFSTDGSIFEYKPQIVVYPRNTQDVRKTARFIWQLAERGVKVPITSRGKGTDQAGAAIGEGLILSFPAHMHKILEIDKDSTVVQPGIIFGKLQQALLTHGRFIPSYPSSMEFSTVGGAVANNASGEYSVKYGATNKYVEGLTVTLANGELIETKPLTKRELKKKQAQTNLEGGIYREIGEIVDKNISVLDKNRLKLRKNTAGYNLFDIQGKKGFDLTPLFVGSQGTLGIVTKIKLASESHNPYKYTIGAYFDDFDKAIKAVEETRKLTPAALEIVDGNLLEFIEEHSPNILRGVIDPPYPKMIMIAEFDDISESSQKRKVKKLKKVLAEEAKEFQITKNEHEQESLWKIRQSSAAVLWQNTDGAKALPLVEDAIVPTEQLKGFIKLVYRMFEMYNLKVSLWGHAGEGQIHVQPFLDITKVSDRQKMYNIFKQYNDVVIKFGGSPSGAHNDGRLRGPYVEKIYGPEMMGLFRRVKKVCDPHGILNPGVKLDVNIDDAWKHLRDDYSMHHLYDHMPRT